MAVTEFYTWDRLGRPLEPAKAVQELVLQCRAFWPDAEFGWMANKEHYEASFPQDHTPYSYTGWPAESPRWWVFATDLMDDPGNGVDLAVVWPVILAEARAGKIPHLKYLIHQAKLYDVRYNWKEQESSGHPHHIHLSFDTNAQFQGLGDWSIGAAMAAVEDNDDYKALRWRIDALERGLDKVAGGPTIGKPFAVNVTLHDLQSKMSALDTRLATIANLLASGAGPGGLTLDQVRAVVRAELDATKFAH